MNVDVISAASAISAFVVSILSVIISLVINKNEIKTETITKNRIEWINRVRDLISDFLDIYMDESIEKTEKNKRLSLIKNKISLYLRANVNSYNHLLKSLNKCIEHGYVNTICNELIENAQLVFSEVWIRAKIESGISSRENIKFEKMFGNPID